MDLNRDPKERCVCAFSFDRSLQEVRKNRGAGSHNLLLFLAGGVRFRKSLISLLRNMHTRALEELFGTTSRLYPLARGPAGGFTHR